MKFGYFTLTDNPVEYSDRKDPNQMVLDLAEQCVYAEDLGYDSVWVPEHHFSVLGVLPSPPVFLSHIAAKTKKIKLAPAVTVTPLNNPIKVAEEYALLDLLSGGRAIFAAGRGYDKREYDVLGVDFTKSREIFFNDLDIIKKAWTNKTFHYNGHEIMLTPRPVQNPHPPIYVAAFSQPSVQKAAEMGEHILYAPFAAHMVFGSLENAVSSFKELAVKHGHKDRKASCSYFINVTDSPEETKKTKQRMLKYFSGLVPAFPGDPKTAPPHIAYFVEIVEKLKKMTTADLSDASIIVGDADYVTQALKKVEATGLEEVLLYFDFGGLPHAETMKAMERFSKYVMPNFQ